MSTFLLSLAVIAFCIAALAVGILLKKDGTFPETSIGKNRDMRRKGIICPIEKERKLYTKSHEYCSNCRKT